MEVTPKCLVSLSLRFTNGMWAVCGGGVRVGGGDSVTWTHSGEGGRGLALGGAAVSVMDMRR